ncbi:hypothetical protein [Paenibacillus sp. Mc5Re-14]|uniref:hypothetical protein n=1 Tax=Paenibacillus sp. Mc5Re-14 TaxID=1030529 RepID=UPI000AC99201|nr:hypothetical protein [Paenibacillus sp. Mc5Re-14]
MLKTMLLLKALISFASTIETEEYTVTDTHIVQDGYTFMKSVNLTEGTQLWFTADNVVGDNRLKVGDIVTGVFNDERLNEDQFFVYKN